LAPAGNLTPAVQRVACGYSNIAIQQVVKYLLKFIEVVITNLREIEEG
jgi:hypothetical protein